MKIESLTSNLGSSLSGPFLLRPDVFSDDRGFFYESWNQKIWETLLLQDDQKVACFVQDNHSYSRKGVLRGLHYQVEPHPQAKLVRCLAGEIFDVVVDLRVTSSTYLEWSGIYLSAANFQQLWVPVGFAHSFLTLSDVAEVLYKTTDFWRPECERTLRWNDPRLSIKWPDSVGIPKLSEKDSLAFEIKDVPQSDLFA